MNKKALVLLLILAVVLVVAFIYAYFNIPIGKRVVNVNTGRTYPTIQAALNASDTVDGNTLLIYPGIYKENIEVRKRVTIKGQERDTVIVEKGSRSVIAILVYSSNSTIANLTVRNSEFGIWLLRTNGGKVTGNRVINCTAAGIRLDYSNNSVVGNNELSDIKLRGIHIFASSNNTIANNNLSKVEGYAAIDVEGNIESRQNSTHNVLFDNQLENNSYGVWINVGVTETRLYHNSFVNNTHQLNSMYSEGTIWDDGYSSGNYWSDFSTRYPNATEIDGSGIWNTPYSIDAFNEDRYPLVSPP